jgi:flagellar motor switch/type III secretory pathway protein FliN
MSASIQNVSAAAAPPDANSAKPVGYGRNPADVLPWLPCTVSLQIPLSHFTIGDLCRLSKGSAVSTSCRHNSEIPLYVNGQLIGWTELEVIDDKLAVRITEIA